MPQVLVSHRQVSLVAGRSSCAKESDENRRDRRLASPMPFLPTHSPHCTTRPGLEHRQPLPLPLQNARRPGLASPCCQARSPCVKGDLPVTGPSASCSLSPAGPCCSVSGLELASGAPDTKPQEGRGGDDKNGDGESTTGSSQEGAEEDSAANKQKPRICG
jgi:hypothetical protein